MTENLNIGNVLAVRECTPLAGRVAEAGPFCIWSLHASQVVVEPKEGTQLSDVTALLCGTELLQAPIGFVSCFELLFCAAARPASSFAVSLSKQYVLLLPANIAVFNVLDDAGGAVTSVRVVMPLLTLPELFCDRVVNGEWSLGATKMAYVVLQQVSSRYAKDNAAKTLDKPVPLRYLERYLPTDKYEELKAKFPKGLAFIWGAKLERSHQIAKMLPDRTLVLFRRGTRVYRAAKIKDVLVNPDLAMHLWGADESGETWGIIYLMQKVLDVSIDAREINESLGRQSTDHWQGMTSVEGEKATSAINLVRAYLQEHRT